MVRLALGIELEVEYWECQTCGGSGAEKVVDECSVCNGTGNHTCEECNGEGEVLCPICEQAGDFIPHRCNSGRIHCESCDGEGSWICSECEGEGKVEVEDECMDCSGTGYEPLPDWADDLHSEHCGVEIKGLIRLPSDEDITIRELAKDLAFTARSGGTRGPCGLHIHVGLASGDEWSYEEVQWIVRVWHAVQPLVWALAETKAVREDYAEYNGSEYPDDPDDQAVSRYYALNAWAAWKDHGSVEFRLWNSSSNEEYVETSIRVSMAVVRLALELQLPDKPINAEATKIREMFINMLPESIQEKLRSSAA